MKKLIIYLLATLTILSITACQATPETPIVVKKDTQRMIEQAQDEDNGQSLNDLSIPTGRYNFESTGLDGRLRISVDAEIQHPNTANMPIIRVSKGGFSQELVTKVFNYLFPNEKPYDISTIGQTKADIEKILLEYRKNLANGSYATDFGYTEEEYLEAISDWEKEYEKAPVTVAEPIRSDGIMKSRPIEGVGNYYRLETCTSKGLPEDGDLSNMFDVSTPDPTSRMAMTGRFSDHLYYFLYSRTGALPEYTSAGTERTDGTNLPQAAKEQLSVSYDDAKAMCDNFFAATGLSDEFSFGMGFLVDDRGTGLVDGTFVNGRFVEGAKGPAKNYAYKLYYTRKIGEIPTMTNTWWGITDGTFAVPWSHECISFIVDNKGLINIKWDDPITVGETISDNSKLKSFDEIISVFEKIIKIQYEATTNRYFGTKGQMEINVDSIRLCLVRVREQNSDALAGLLVPAWVFYGNNKAAYSDGKVSYDFGFGGMSTIPKEPFPIIVINAVDGSIIDLSKGY